MNIYDLIIKDGDVSLFVLFADVFLGLFLSMIICYVYRITFKGISYSQTFLISLIMIAIITAVLISIIGSNLARAFSLVGALSIIRYRTAIKDPRDTGFIFLTVATGMIIGAGYYFFAVSLVLFISILLVLLDKFDFASDIVHRNIIKVALTGSDVIAPDKEISKILKSHFQQTSLLEHHWDKNKNSVLMTYIATRLDKSRIKSKQRQREEQVIKQIESMENVQTVSLLTDQLQQNI